MVGFIVVMLLGLLFTAMPVITVVLAVKGVRKSMAFASKWQDAFSRIVPGWTMDNVRQVMGDPTRTEVGDGEETWYYSAQSTAMPYTYCVVFDSSRRGVLSTSKISLESLSDVVPGIDSVELHTLRERERNLMQIHVGSSRTEVLELLGRPHSRWLDVNCVVWEYPTKSRNKRHLVNAVRFDLQEMTVVDVTRSVIHGMFS